MPGHSAQHRILPPDLARTSNRRKLPEGSAANQASDTRAPRCLILASKGTALVFFPLPGDEEPIKALLEGNDADIEAGLNWLDQQFREKVCGLLRRRFPGMPSADLAEVWRDSLLTLHYMVRRGSYDSSGSLIALVWRIAVRRSQDRLRRNPGWDHPIDAMMRDVTDPEILEKWRQLNALQKTEIVDLICDSANKLPPQQQLVWRLYVEYFPESQDIERLTEEIRNSVASPARDSLLVETATNLGPEIVTAALQAGRAKIREDLKRKGYEL
jgi:hypothetical protein